MDLSWMAWTWPTALFFIVIVCLLLGMAFWEYKSPGGDPRIGVLRFETTRGDRLFISLLGSAFIHIAWLGLSSLNLWWALALSLIYAFCVFKYV
jgi:predicted small integral membrane protein